MIQKLKNKNITLGFLGCLLTTFSIWGQEDNCGTPVKENLLLPADTIIAFDIDGVVLVPRDSEYEKWIQEHPQLGLTYQVTAKKYELIEPIEVLEKIIEDAQISGDISLVLIAQEYITLITNSEPIHETWQIIDYLTNKGYVIIAATNRASSTYICMVTNGTLHKSFDKDFFFTSTNSLNKKDENSFYVKPDQMYFQNLKQYIERKFPNRFKNIVFIDDKADNVESAAKVGLITLEFRPMQLEDSFKKMGIYFY